MTTRDDDDLVPSLRPYVTAPGGTPVKVAPPVLRAVAPMEAAHLLAHPQQQQYRATVAPIDVNDVVNTQSNSLPAPAPAAVPGSGRTGRIYNIQPIQPESSRATAARLLRPYVPRAVVLQTPNGAHAERHECLVSAWVEYYAENVVAIVFPYNRNSADCATLLHNPPQSPYDYSMMFNSEALLLSSSVQMDLLKTVLRLLVETRKVRAYVVAQQQAMHYQMAHCGGTNNSTSTYDAMESVAGYNPFAVGSRIYNMVTAIWPTYISAMLAFVSSGRVLSKCRSASTRLEVALRALANAVETVMGALLLANECVQTAFPRDSAHQVPVNVCALTQINPILLGFDDVPIQYDGIRNPTLGVTTDAPPPPCDATPTLMAAQDDNVPTSSRLLYMDCFRRLCLGADYNVLRTLDTRDSVSVAAVLVKPSNMMAAMACYSAAGKFLASRINTGLDYASMPKRRKRGNPGGTGVVNQSPRTPVSTPRKYRRSATGAKTRVRRGAATDDNDNGADVQDNGEDVDADADHISDGDAQPEDNGVVEEEAPVPAVRNTTPRRGRGMGRDHAASSRMHANHTRAHRKRIEKTGITRCFEAGTMMPGLLQRDRPTMEVTLHSLTLLFLDALYAPVFPLGLVTFKVMSLLIKTATRLDVMLHTMETNPLCIAGSAVVDVSSSPNLADTSLAFMVPLHTLTAADGLLKILANCPSEKHTDCDELGLYATHRHLVSLVCRFYFRLQCLAHKVTSIFALVVGTLATDIRHRSSTACVAMQVHHRMREQYTKLCMERTALGALGLHPNDVRVLTNGARLDAVTRLLGNAFKHMSHVQASFREQPTLREDELLEFRQVLHIPQMIHMTDGRKNVRYDPTLVPEEAVVRCMALNPAFQGPDPYPAEQHEIHNKTIGRKKPVGATRCGPEVVGATGNGTETGCSSSLVQLPPNFLEIEYNRKQTECVRHSVDGAIRDTDELEGLVATMRAEVWKLESLGYVVGCGGVEPAPSVSTDENGAVPTAATATDGAQAAPATPATHDAAANEPPPPVQRSTRVYEVSPPHIPSRVVSFPQTPVSNPIRMPLRGTLEGITIRMDENPYGTGELDTPATHTTASASSGHNQDEMDVFADYFGNDLELPDIDLSDIPGMAARWETPPLHMRPQMVAPSQYENYADPLIDLERDAVVREMCDDVGYDHGAGADVPDMTDFGDGMNRHHHGYTNAAVAFADSVMNLM